MGKKTVIICVALLVLAVCAVSFRHQEYFGLVVAGLVVAIVFFGLKSIDGTLEKHPELALLDGTEIVRIKQIEMMAAKNIQVFPETPLTNDPNPPRLGSAPLELGTSMSDDEEEQ